jgi:hypothetical protein
MMARWYRQFGIILIMQFKHGYLRHKEGIMGRIKVAILIIMLVFIAAPAALADSWTPWYIVSSSLPDPANPPGGAGWTAWSSNPVTPVVVPNQNYLWIGAENIPRPNYMKIGELRFTYSFEDFAYPDYGGPGGNEAAGGGTFTYWHGYTVFPGGNLETEVVDFHIIPQPSWEWFRFQNIPEPGHVGGNLTIFAMSMDTNCVPIPLPGAVWLLGSGLLGLGAWRRVWKS